MRQKTLGDACKVCGSDVYEERRRWRAGAEFRWAANESTLPPALLGMAAPARYYDLVRSLLRSRSNLGESHRMPPSP